jgi:hypothetical protein
MRLFIAALLGVALLSLAVAARDPANALVVALTAETVDPGRH